MNKLRHDDCCLDEMFYKHVYAFFSEINELYIVEQLSVFNSCQTKEPCK